MAGDTATRVQTVTANLAAIKLQMGDDNWFPIIIQLLTDMNVSLATLVDNDTTST